MGHRYGDGDCQVSQNEDQPGERRAQQARAPFRLGFLRVVPLVAHQPAGVEDAEGRGGEQGWQVDRGEVGGRRHEPDAEELGDEGDSAEEEGGEKEADVGGSVSAQSDHLRIINNLFKCAHSRS